METMILRPAAMASLYRFPTGRRLHAQREIARRATVLAIAPILAHTTRAITHEERVMAMEAAIAAATSTQYGTSAPELDRQVDRAITGTDLHLEAHVRVYGEHHPIGRDARLVREELLPDGARAITRLPYATQHERVAALLAAAEAPGTELAAAVQRIPALPDMLAQLRVVNDQYGASLQDYDRGRPTREELAEAQAEGQDLLAESVFVIMAHYAGQPALRAERDSLLEPVLRQNEAIRQARRRRRGAVDIDPDTGAELPDTGGELPDDDDVLPVSDTGAP
jgi:hypothetical protein